MRTLTCLLLLTTCCLPLQAKLQDQPAQPPVLETPRVSFVTPQPPLPPAELPDQSNANYRQYRDGFMQIRIAGAALPIAGTCCFCPDGSEKPAQWKAAETKAGSNEKR